MKTFLAFLAHRTLARIVGVAAAALLIWFVGPVVAIGEAKPLEPERARWIAIGMLVGWIVVDLAWRFILHAVRSRKLVGGLAEGAHPAEGLGAGAAEVALLGKRFEEALEILKDARLEARRSGGLASLLSLRHFVYDLPWYVVIGAPGSGKTTALVNSGLEFPLADKLGQAAVSGVGGTRNCDWWFTHDAVLLDTAGRYTTQDSDAAGDRDAWIGFLKLIRKYRPRRPINGVLLTLSVADLLGHNQAENERLAAHLRARLQELHEHLGTRFPVYVLVTKTDLLAGFMEFFGEYPRDHRAQVWGCSFPYDGNLDRYQPLARLPAELAALGASLNARLIAHARAEPDRDRRALIYAFPQQWQILAGTVDDMVARIFQASRFESCALLRGVYFTSGTQEGAPLDRVFGRMARALGLQGRAATGTQRPTGKSFFVTRLLQDVVFGEASLAGVNLRWERRRVLAVWTVRAACVALTGGLLAFWTISYRDNVAYVDHVAGRIDQVDRTVGMLKTAGTTDLVGILPVVAAVQDLAGSHATGAYHAPIRWRIGLWQGDKLGDATSDAYAHLLRDAFLPRLVERIEARLRAAGPDDADMTYEDLKAYLMLHDPRRFDADAIRAYVYADWERTLAREVTLSERQALRAHLDTLLVAGDVASELTPDRQLIDDARTLVTRTPIAQRVYGRLKRLRTGNDQPDFTIPRAAGPAAGLVLARASGAPLARGVPGLYTRAGYHQAFLPAMTALATRFAEESDWVLGVSIGGTARDTAAQLVRDTVDRLYLTEYAAEWEAFIHDLRLRPTHSLRETIELAQFASAPDSPLVALFAAIVPEVTLAHAPEADAAVPSLVEQATSALKHRVDELKRLAGRHDPSAGNAAAHTLAAQLVDARFEGLRRLFTAARGQPLPAQNVLALMGDLHGMMLTAETALRSRATPPASDLPVRIHAEASRLPEPFRAMLVELTQLGTTQSLAITRDHIGRQVRTALTEFCGRAIAGRYPFNRASGLDVTQADFGRFFGAGGMMDGFFQKHLAAYVDTSVLPWALRRHGEAGMGAPSSALPQFQRAQRIRGAFFAEGAATPVLRMHVKPLDLDRNITQVTLDIDGQAVRYSHGPQVPVAVQWPGPRATGQVRLTIEPTPPSGRAGLLHEGPWALLRLLDGARIERGREPERTVATFEVDGRLARFEFTAAGVDSPFRLPELEQFRCPEGL